jgi:hypothetical protein
LFAPSKKDVIDNIVARIVNEFYHCKAMLKLIYHKRSDGQYYSKWKIMLYHGNNPDWLQAHEKELLAYLKKIQISHVSQIEVIAG